MQTYRFLGRPRRTLPLLGLLGRGAALLAVLLSQSFTSTARPRADTASVRASPTSAGRARFVASQRSLSAIHRARIAGARRPPAAGR